jgi:hypothetical protein
VHPVVEDDVDTICLPGHWIGCLNNRIREIIPTVVKDDIRP